MSPTGDKEILSGFVSISAPAVRHKNERESETSLRILCVLGASAV
jgi:hypothetical protein